MITHATLYTSFTMGTAAGNLHKVGGVVAKYEDAARFAIETSRPWPEQLPDGISSGVATTINAGEHPSMVPPWGIHRVWVFHPDFVEMLGDSCPGVAILAALNGNQEPSVVKTPNASPAPTPTIPSGRLPAAQNISSADDQVSGKLGVVERRGPNAVAEVGGPKKRPPSKSPSVSKSPAVGKTPTSKLSVGTAGKTTSTSGSIRRK